MKTQKTEDLLKQDVKKDVDRIKKSERERNTLLSQTVYLGSIGIIISLPIVGGAYLGKWMDDKELGFSFSWTITLILLGVVFGAFNAYIFVKRNDV